MTHQVYFTGEAEKDLMEIYESIRDSGRPMTAKSLLKMIRQTCDRLSEMPERGRTVPELHRIGISDYREILFKIYRILYEIEPSHRVVIHCILDGRRDVQTVLAQRMLR
jgi:toxin ParE1/3/4